MKPIAILIVGCLPLSILAVRAFVELGSVDHRPELPKPAQVGSETEPLADVARIEEDKSLAGKMAEVDLLAGESLVDAAKLADPSILKPVVEVWPEWTSAHALVKESLRTERSIASTVLAPLEEADLEDLQNAKLQLDELKQKCDDSSVPGCEGLSRHLQRRIAALDREIELRQLRKEAEQLWARASSEFDSEQYGQCMLLCDELQSDYSTAIVAGMSQNAASLRRRAEFWNDNHRLVSLLEAASALERRKAILASFLNKYRRSGSFGSQEQTLLDRYNRELDDIQIELDNQLANRTAGQLIDELRNDLPGDFSGRLQSAVRIVGDYPTDTVKATLRDMTILWLEEFLPEKSLEELHGLEEAETARREIVRGFFDPVVTPDGTVFGYKRYPTPQARADPAFDVGTYRKEEFLVEPAASVPGQCITSYNQSRTQLLKDPGRQEAWSRFAATCESLDARLSEYRKKKGASTESISFLREGQFARKFMAGDGLADGEAILGGK